jgi:hypothetical protein
LLADNHRPVRFLQALRGTTKNYPLRFGGIARLIAVAAFDMSAQQPGQVLSPAEVHVATRTKAGGVNYDKGTCFLMWIGQRCSQQCEEHRDVTTRRCSAAGFPTGSIPGGWSPPHSCTAQAMIVEPFQSDRDHGRIAFSEALTAFRLAGCEQTLGELAAEFSQAKVCEHTYKMALKQFQLPVDAGGHGRAPMKNREFKKQQQAPARATRSRVAGAAQPTAKRARPPAAQCVICAEPAEEYGAFGAASCQPLWCRKRRLSARSTRWPTRGRVVGVNESVARFFASWAAFRPPRCRR